MLDGGPSRKSQAMQGRASMRLGSSGRQQEAVQPAPSQSSQGDAVLAPRLDTVSQPQRRSSRLPFIGVLVGAILVVILTIGWAFWFKGQNSAVVLPIETDKYQAVFLSGGQVYFGKLEAINSSYVKLSDVFYIQSGSVSDGSSGEDPQDTDDGSMQLIKLGEEVHGPEDAMIINRDQVLFYENLKPAGRVSQLIQNYKSGNN